MGGTVIDISADTPFIPEKETLWTLTPSVFIEAVRIRPALFRDLVKAEIQDKSKASNLAKAIVCFQASWFMLQCVSRLAQLLPISLLEVRKLLLLVVPNIPPLLTRAQLNTVAHCICALLIYLLWWEKPLDIDTPLKLRSQSATEFLAWYWMCTHGRADASAIKREVENQIQLELAYRINNIRAAGFNDASFDIIRHLQERGTIRGFEVFENKEAVAEFQALAAKDAIRAIRRMDIKDTTAFGNLRYQDGGESVRDHIRRAIETKERLEQLEQRLTTQFGAMKEIQYVKAAGFRDVADLQPSDDEELTRLDFGQELAGTGLLYDPGYKPLMPMQLGRPDKERWRLASAIIREGHTPSLPMELLSGRAHNFPPLRSISSWGVRVGVVFAIFILAGFFYGGIHALSWNTRFPSRAEEIMWKTSISLIMVYGAVFVLGVQGWRSLSWELPESDRRNAQHLDWAIRQIVLLLSLALAPVLGIGYVLARVYLVVECFLSLTHASPDIYSQPTWTAYFPHIS